MFPWLPSPDCVFPPLTGYTCTQPCLSAFLKCLSLSGFFHFSVVTHASSAFFRNCIIFQSFYISSADLLHAQNCDVVPWPTFKYTNILNITDNHKNHKKPAKTTSCTCCFSFSACRRLWPNSCFSLASSSRTCCSSFWLCARSSSHCLRSCSSACSRWSISSARCCS